MSDTTTEAPAETPAPFPPIDLIDCTPSTVAPVLAANFGKVVTVLAFRNRFTKAEKVGIEIAGIDNPAAPMPQRLLSASVRTSQKDLDNATYVQLDRADLLTDLQGLAAGGILAEERPAQIVGPCAGSVELPAFLRVKFGLPEIPSDHERQQNGGRGYLTPEEAMRK